MMMGIKGRKILLGLFEGCLLAVQYVAGTTRGFRLLFIVHVWMT